VAFIESARVDRQSHLQSRAVRPAQRHVVEFKDWSTTSRRKGIARPLFTSDEAYKKAMAAIDKVNVMVDDLQAAKARPASCSRTRTV